MIHSSNEATLKSDAGLQVERTTLSWFRTLFVSFLIALSILKKALDYEGGTWLFALFFASALSIATYYSLYFVSSACIRRKAGRYKIITLSLGMAAFLSGVGIVVGT
ncbi:DUF202 domain-containing protein [Vibrio sp. ER1A]|uniref:DUF202 domain-containing protein n=1 Tax=Vibrio sp. ER1A TaxID=1517681 RepID=UPI00068A698B|nr:DUF202 domain-containing protein [Vibrio sp. ER1A]